MRTFLASLVILSSAAMVLPALAVQASDPMRLWKDAPEKERASLLEQILGEKAHGAGVSKCMDETSTTPGHSDLPIGEVAKVCASARADQPV